MRKNATYGLTLIELLVGMALLSIIMAALMSFFSQSSRSSMQSSARADLQQETLNAQQLITGRIREAYKIFPTGTTLNFGTGSLRKNPVTNDGNWKVGTHPILALILPPKIQGGACTAPSTSASTEGESGGFFEAPTSSAGSDGCYRFLAYYPVKRSQWTGNTSGANNPGAETSNNDTWVLVEYQDYYYGTTVAPSGMAIPSTSPNRSKVYLLTDYVAPTVVTPAASVSTAQPATTRAYTMFTLGDAPETTVTFRLAAVRSIAGKVIRLPGDASEYAISAIPTNLGKIAAN